MFCGLLGSAASAADVDWPSDNRMLSDERYSALADISRANVKTRQVMRTFDSGSITSFQSGIIEVGVALRHNRDGYLQDRSCKLCAAVARARKLRECFKVNRGLAYLDGRLFRGTQAGRVLAYEATSGKRLWEARVGDPHIGESVPAAPIAWRGLEFVGNAGGDNKGVKERMHALHAATGKSVWKFDMVPADPSAAHALGWANAADVGRTLYAFDAEGGQVLWSRKLDRALGGGVITYRVNGVQCVADAAGMTSPIWPTENAIAKILVLGVAP